MADETLEVLIKMRGGRAAAAEIKGVTKETDRLGKTTGRSAIASDRAASSSGRLRGAWGGLIGVGARLGATLGAGGLAGSAFFAMKAFSEKQRAVAQTAAVLKSTGGAANITEKQIDRLSTRVARMAGVDDEVVRAGQNMLLTFRDVRNEQGKGNDIFTQGVLAAADLSQAYTAMGKNMSVADASLQIGKALNDPVRGMSRLQRIGVTFTEQQQKQAEAMMKAGDRMGAQKIILAELNAEFGGSAAAQGKTLAGTWGRVRFEAGELAETLGSKLAPLASKGLGVLSAGIAKVSKIAPGFQKAWKRGGVLGVVDQLDKVTGAGGKFSKGFRTVMGAVVPVLTTVFGVAKNLVVGLFEALKPAMPFVENVLLRS
jgi:hypothetical protein